MKSSQKKSIGIIGGMGPDASAQLYQLMIQVARKKYHAQQNHEYPDIIIHSIPVPDFISNKSNVPVALKMLRQSARQLGPLCGVLGMACNTAHLLIKDLQAETKTPFVPMIEAVTAKVVKEGYTRIGLLATPTTFKSELYQDAFKKFKLKLIVPPPEEIEKLGGIVQSIVRGNLHELSNRLEKVADILFDKGAEVIVLGCTELPLVFPKKYKLPTVSSLEVLAETLLDIYYANK